MATWIVHLRIAENLLSKIPGLDENAFTLGNVAPDSGIPDEKWEKFDPPPAVTHFQPADNSVFRCADLEFFRSYLLPLRSGTPPADLFSMRLGYFFHLVTDNLWYAQVGKPAHDRWRADFSSESQFWNEIKSDWYGLDHSYVRSQPDCLFWRVLVNCAYTENHLPFLPPQAIKHQLAHIQNYYRREDKDIKAMLTRPFRYLSAAHVTTFVTEISSKLEKIYQHLWAGAAVCTEGISALQTLGKT